MIKPILVTYKKIFNKKMHRAIANQILKRMKRLVSCFNIVVTHYVNFFFKKISYDHIHFSIIKMSENLNQEVRTFSKVWKHFDLVSDGKKAKCHYCG